MLTIAYDHEFDKTLAAIHSDFERADEFIEGTEWVLARDPHTGTCIDKESNLWAIVNSDGEHLVCYTFDTTRVYLLALIAGEDDLESGEPE